MNLGEFFTTIKLGHSKEDAVIYNADGDFLLVVFENRDSFTERFDEVLTVMRAIDDEDCVVGFKIKGFRRLLSQFKELGIEFRRKAHIKVFLKQLDWKKGLEPWKTYQLLVAKSDDLTVDTDLLNGCLN